MIYGARDKSAHHIITAIELFCLTEPLTGFITRGRGGDREEGTRKVSRVIGRDVGK